MKFKRTTHSFAAQKYATDVIAGKIEACWQVRAACQRYIDDFKRSDINYRADFAEHACNFVSQLPHVVGPLAGEKIKLEPFQQFILCNLFGWVDCKTNLRRYREALIMLPRGSAKSTLAAGIALYLTFALGEGGAQSFSGATSMAQASAVFEPARQMAIRTPELCDQLGLVVGARSIYQPHTGSSFQPVIAKTKDGGIPWLAITDELHEAINGTQLAAFRTGMGKRRGSDPLLLIITTAGTNLGGVCRTEQLYFEGILTGLIKDDSKFCLVYTIDKGDDWLDFRVWKKANPAYGSAVDEKHLKREYERARQSPAAQAECLTKYLNVWQASSTSWLNQRIWAESANLDLEIEEFYGSKAFLGVDLATKTDLVALTLIIPRDGKRYIFPFLFVPAGALDAAKNASAYKNWHEIGHLTVTEGSASDYEAVLVKIRELMRLFRIEMGMFDDYQAEHIRQICEKDGMPTKKFAMNNKHAWTIVMDDFEADLSNGLIVHPDNQCLNWCAVNISSAARGRTRQPVKPDGQPHLKIDGMIAALMAYAASCVETPEPIAVAFEWF